MKMQCTFTFFGEVWTCTRTSTSGASSEPSLKQLQVNKNYDSTRFRDYLHHELLESAEVLSGCEYKKTYPDRDGLYIMDHTSLNNVSTSVRTAYDEVVFKMNAFERPKK